MYVNSEAWPPTRRRFYLWVWVGVFFVAGIGVAVLGWRGNSWWRRGFAVLAIPLTLLAALVALNKWVGYYPSVQTAWGGALTAGPLPNQVDASELPELRNTVQSSGKLVEVDIAGDASGFKHRSEYVYLPPAWFAGATLPKLPVIMMVAGEFNTPADWIRTGNALPIIDGYAKSHGGAGPPDLCVRRLRWQLQQRHRMRQRSPPRQRRRPPDQGCPALSGQAIQRIGPGGQLGGGRLVDGRHLRYRPDCDAPRVVQRLRGHRRRSRPPPRAPRSRRSAGSTAATPRCGTCSIHAP